MSESIVQVSNLTKQFKIITAIDRISFELYAGSIVGLVGQNGSGKTTTISMLLGLLYPSSGSIEIFGEQVPQHRHRVLHRMNFGSPYVDLPWRLKVYENLKVYARLYGLSNPTSRVERVAHRLDIVDLLNIPIRELSDGQRSRVYLAKSLINDPDFLLLDEPTASLDPSTAHWIRRVLREYVKKTGGTILFSSHNMAEVEDLCDHIMILHMGRLVDSGSPTELTERYGRESLEEILIDVFGNDRMTGLENEVL